MSCINTPPPPWLRVSPNPSRSPRTALRRLQLQSVTFCHRLTSRPFNQILHDLLSTLSAAPSNRCSYIRRVVRTFIFYLRVSPTLKVCTQMGDTKMLSLFPSEK